MNDRSPVSWIVWVLVAAAIVALVLLVRGTPDHSRYDDAPVSSAIEILA